MESTGFEDLGFSDSSSGMLLCFLTGRGSDGWVHRVLVCYFLFHFLFELFWMKVCVSGFFVKLRMKG